MSTQKPSKCCVCGEATDKRCGPCGKNGIDLFFCSPEHQKLVWKYHKQICGPNANPIRPPALSNDEVIKLRAVARHSVPVNLNLLPPHLQQLGPQYGFGSSPEVDVATGIELAAKTPAGSFESIVVPMLLSPPPTFTNTHRYLLLSESRRLFLAHVEGIWAQVARFQLNSFARDLNMAMDITPYMDLASRMAHVLLIMIALVRLRTTEPAAIPLAWVKRAFERFADLVADIKPFQNAQDAAEAMSWYLHHVSLLTRQPCRVERESGTNKLVFRFAD
ncbi:hypothetical protein BJY59DRAFT_725049 [Rhodotorula toruloides]